MENAEKQRLEVITTQLIQFFKFHNILAKVKIKDACLLILLESDKLPEQQMSVDFIRGQLINFELEGIQCVQICGRESVGKHQTWKYKFEDLGNKQSQMPLGYTFETKLVDLKKEIVTTISLCLFFLVLTEFIAGAIVVASGLMNFLETIKLMISSFLFLSLLLVSLALIFTVIFFNKQKSIRILVKNNKTIVARADLVESQNILQVAYLKVSKKWRRRGLGSALVKHIIQEANKPIRLGCHVDLISFYTRLGFIQSGTPTKGTRMTTMVYLLKK